MRRTAPPTTIVRLQTISLDVTMDDPELPEVLEGDEDLFRNAVGQHKQQSWLSMR